MVIDGIVHNPIFDTLKMEHSDKPEGMVQRWREQAIDRTATWIMLNNLKQRYEEMTGKTS